jgi:Tol biopolymer transport system component
VLESVTGEVPTWFYAPRLSPDGRSMLVSQYESNGKLGQFWVHDLERRVANRLTFDQGDNYLGVWLPGGREVLYNCAPPGATTGICRVALDHPGDERLWLQGPNTTAPDTAARDGRRVVFEQADAQGRFTLWLRELEGEAAPIRLTPEGVGEFSADLSPDGEWLAYLSDAGGEFGVYLRRLDGRGGAIRISPGAGGQPLWRRDGRELFYVDPLGRMVAVPITPGDPPRPGAPTVLFDARLEDASDRQYDVSADGQRFLLNRRLNTDEAPLVVVLDWKSLLDGKSE